MVNMSSKPIEDWLIFLIKLSQCSTYVWSKDLNRGVYIIIHHIDNYNVVMVCIDVIKSMYFKDNSS